MAYGATRLPELPNLYCSYTIKFPQVALPSHKIHILSDITHFSAETSNSEALKTRTAPGINLGVAWAPTSGAKGGSVPPYMSLGRFPVRDVLKELQSRGIYHGQFIAFLVLTRGRQHLYDSAPPPAQPGYNLSTPQDQPFLLHQCSAPLYFKEDLPAPSMPTNPEAVLPTTPPP
ncbi:hypothetical protein FB451DRAFT_1179112 [Mycena latifolia]|nr:hypothetical protein FB451DRAFT_1179112 [Mycena latifolia]